MKKTKQGFTLVELIIVIAVIGVLAAILIPVFANVIDKANAKSALSDGRNSVEQYIVDATDDATLPHNVTVFVKKGSSMYIYGYNMDSEGSMMMAREGKAYKKYSTPAELMADYSFNDKHPGMIPDLTGATIYDEENDGTFWLVPYTAEGVPTTEAANAGVKGFHGTKEPSEMYCLLNDKMTETMGEDVWIYHGYMLNGTYAMDGGSDGTDESGVKYTITFAKGNTEGNDAKVEVPDPVQVEEGRFFTPGSYTASYAHAASDPVWYVFDGWDETAFTVDGNKTVTATWIRHEAVTYTLHFNPGEGSLALAAGVTDGMQIVDGSNVTDYIMDSAATRSGYTFGGWDNGAGVVYNNAYIGSIIMNDDMNLTAVWMETKYALNINNANGDATYKLGDYSQGTNNVTLPAAPVKEGYVFDYWKSSVTDENGIEFAANATYSMPGQDVTMTAQWKDKFTVEYYAYDGTTDAAGTIEVNADDTIDLPNTTSVIKPNTPTVDYTFTGWACSLGGTYAPGDEYTVIGDVTFTAVFADVPKFMVSFTAGELAGNPNVSGIPTSFYATPTTVINPNTYGTPTFEYPGSGSDYTFDGWQPATVTMADSTVTFEAQWVEVPYYTLTFDKGAGDSMSLSTLTGWSNGGTLRSGTNITDLVKNSTATKDGVEFLGWKLGETTYNSASSAVPFTGNTTFVAQFSNVKYSVQYQAGEGSGADYTQGSYEANESITLALGSQFTAPTGKIFSHWQSSLPEADYGSGAAYTVTNSVIFTAIWIEDTGIDVTVKFADSWNGDTVEGSEKVNVPTGSTTVNYSQVPASIVPDYWAQDATVIQSITTGNVVTFTGTRLAKLSGSSYGDFAQPTATGVTYATGDTSCYQIITKAAGFTKIADRLAGRYYMTAGGFSRTAIFGTSSNKFTGVLDGGDKTVNFKYGTSSTSQQYVGLFAYNNGTIRNLTVSLNGAVYGHSYIGGICGYNNGTIDNCKVTNITYSINGMYGDGNTYLAGVAGYNAGTIQHTSCDIGSVLNQGGGDYTGGITANNAATGTILDCQYTGGRVVGNSTGYYVGGVTGENYGTISWCSVILPTSGTSTAACIWGSEYIGGISGTNGGTIEYCAMEAMWPATANPGGVGTTNTSNSAAGYGGLVGYMAAGKLENSYARMYRFNGRNYAGGAVGLLEGGTCKNLYVSKCTGFSAIASNAGWDTAPQSNNSFTSCYCITSGTGYLRKFTQATSDADLKTKASANASWTSAGCWDFSGSYVKLVTWASLHSESTIKFEANKSGVTNPADKEIAYGESFTMPTLEAPSGWNFLGWAASSTATTADHAAGATVVANGNKTYYGVWASTATFDITFAKGTESGATNMPSNITDIAHNSSVTLPSTVPTTATEGISFEEWTDGTNTYQPGATISNITADITLTATWGGFTEITTQAQLAAISSDLDGKYILMNDIALTGNWDPIGDGSNAFTGIFNGNGKSITNLTADYYSDGTDYIGLFAKNSGTIKNLTVIATTSGGSYGVYGGCYVGAIAGRNEASGVITNCHVQGTIGSMTDYNDHGVGAIAGGSFGTISQCSFTNGQVEALTAGGGIVGQTSGGSISECYVNASVNTGNGQDMTYGTDFANWIQDSQPQQIGGIVGKVAGGTTITNCCVDLQGYEMCAHQALGGIVGYASASGDGTVTNSYFSSVGGRFESYSLDANQIASSKVTKTNCANGAIDSLPAGWSTSIWQLSGTKAQLKFFA